MAWIARFIYNCQHPNDVIRGPLTTDELMSQHGFWIKRAQQSRDNEEDRLRLNLQPNEQGILQCRGRVQGEYPIYLPDSHPYTKKLVQREHLRTLHGGVQLTMTSVRKDHWVPRLYRDLSRKLRKSATDVEGSKPELWRMPGVFCPPPSPALRGRRSAISCSYTEYFDVPSDQCHTRSTATSLRRD